MIFNVQRHIIDATRFPCNFTGIHYYFELNIVYIHVFDNFEQIFHQWIHCIVTRCKYWVMCLLERCTVCYIIGISKKYFFYWSCWIWTYIIFPVLSYFHATLKCCDRTRGPWFPLFYECSGIYILLRWCICDCWLTVICCFTSYSTIFLLLYHHSNLRWSAVNLRP